MTPEQIRKAAFDARRALEAAHNQMVSLAADMGILIMPLEKYNSYHCRKFIAIREDCMVNVRDTIEHNGIVLVILQDDRVVRYGGAVCETAFEAAYGAIEYDEYLKF